jgi:hypothetical protein
MALAVFGGFAGIDLYGFFWPTVAALSFSWIAHYLLALVYIRRQHQQMELDVRGQGQRPKTNTQGILKTEAPDPPQKAS